MDVPRLLAIDHVQMTVPIAARDAVLQFYAEVLGFEPIPAGPENPCLIFRGFPRSGPRLMVTLANERTAGPPRRRALVQVGSLHACAELLSERGFSFEWARGWFFYERRLNAIDPGGNWIELVASHPA